MLTARLIAAAACIVLAAGLPSDGAGQSAPDPALDRVIADLNDWLEGHCAYPVPEGPLPKIGFVHIGDTVVMDGEQCTVEEGIHGIYDETANRILLVEPWDPDDAFDRSVLLHELVHHRQTTLAWECPQATEKPAYAMQEAWLAEQGIDPDFNWLLIYLRSRCQPISPHPD